MWRPLLWDQFLNTLSRFVLSFMLISLLSINLYLKSCWNIHCLMGVSLFCVCVYAYIYIYIYENSIYISFKCFIFLSTQRLPLVKGEGEQKLPRGVFKGGDVYQAPIPLARTCHPTDEWRPADKAVAFWETPLWHDPQRAGGQRAGAREEGWLLWAAWRDRPGQFLHGQAGHPRPDERSGHIQVHTAVTLELN